jgi:hypothetical protein
MMAKRRSSRHDALETVSQTAHWLIGGIDYKTGRSLLGCGSRDGDGKLRGVGGIFAERLEARRRLRRELNAFLNGPPGLQPGFLDPEFWGRQALHFNGCGVPPPAESALGNVLHLDGDRVVPRRLQ